MAISARGACIANFPRPPFFEVYLSRKGRPGAVNFCMAENRISKHLVEEKLQAIGSRVHEDGGIGYADYNGEPVLRAALAGFFTRYFVTPATATTTTASIDPNTIKVVNGVSTALWQMALSLCDAGEAMVVTAPMYYSFPRDLGIVTENVFALCDPARETDGSGRATLAAIRAACEKQRARGVKVRAIVLANPSNPTGDVLGRAALTSVIDWAGGQGIHVVVDEIYALSVFRDVPHVPSGRFESVLSMYAKGLPSHVHMLWGASKDFCGAGLRTGVVVSANRDLHAAIAKLGIFFQVPTALQHQLARMLADHAWLDSVYLPAMRAGLEHACGIVERHLTAAGIPFHRPTAAFFIWCDLRAYVAAHGTELGLVQHLADRGVLLVPGSACGEEGWARLCFAALTPEEVDAGMVKLVRALQGGGAGAAKL